MSNPKIVVPAEGERVTVREGKLLGPPESDPPLDRR